MRRPRSFVVVPLALLAVVLAAGCSSSKSSSDLSTATAGTAPIPKYGMPANPMALATAAGLVPEDAERLEYHVHAHLDMFENGAPVTMPGGIGIDTTNPAIHYKEVDGQATYGYMSVACDKPCISPLHTHGPDGVIHTESATKKTNTFGQLLTEWNVTLPAGTKVYVNGKAFTGDPKTISLADRTEIAVVIGTPPATIPSSYSGF